MMHYIAEGISLTLNEGRCVGCGLCVVVCPHRIFKMNGAKAFISDKHHCMECGACKSNCPVDAIDVNSGTGCAQMFLNRL